MPDHGEGDFARISQGLQGARADVQPAAYGVVVEPFVGLGRIADVSRSIQWIKSAKAERYLFQALLSTRMICMVFLKYEVV